MLIGPWIPICKLRKGGKRLGSESERGARRYLQGAQYPASKGKPAAESVECLQGLEGAYSSRQDQKPNEFSSFQEGAKTLERLR